MPKIINENDLTLGICIISKMVLFPFLGCTLMLFITENFLIFTIQDTEIKVHFIKTIISGKLSFGFSFVRECDKYLIIIYKPKTKMTVSSESID